MATADGLCRSLFSGCIGGDTEIERRPYHRNCGCALHRSGVKNCSHAMIPNVSYPIRRSWSEGCLASVASGYSSSSSSSSPLKAQLSSNDQEVDGGFFVKI